MRRVIEHPRTKVVLLSLLPVLATALFMAVGPSTLLAWLTLLAMGLGCWELLQDRG